MTKNKGLGEDVSRLVLKSKTSKIKNPMKKVMINEMTVNLSTFFFLFIKDEIVSNLNSTLIITIKWCDICNRDIHILKMKRRREHKQRSSMCQTEHNI